MYREVSIALARRLGVFIFAAFTFFLLPGLPVSGANDYSSPNWSTKFDSEVRFYQTTELGALVVGTEKSLYAVDGESGEVLWRRKNVRLDETDVAPVAGTDLLLLNLEKDRRARLEAV